MIKSLGIFLLLFFMLIQPLQAEYRAYLLEVFDHIAKKKWDAATGFSPDKYILSHGGGNRLSVLLKATWHCYNDTSGYKSLCAMPATIKPLFQVGDKVKITLDKHISEGWIGTVELSLYRQELNSNVYGVRFNDRKQMYGRYFEFNLQKISAPEPPNQLKPQIK